MAEEILETSRSAADYTDSSIRHLDDMEHIRLRPGMYIGRLGDGSQPEDGIYVLLKESIDNSIDEFNEGFGKKIEVDITETTAAIRDYGRGIPLGSLIPAVSKLNTGGKYDNDQYTASVGLNGVGLKAVNALALRFTARSTRDGEYHEVQFERGHLVSDKSGKTEEENGTYIAFEPDPTLFTGYRFRGEFVKEMLRNYTYLNTGLAIFHNGSRIISRNGLEDLLSDKMTDEALYPIVHIKGDGIEIAFTHAKNQNGEEYYSFVNGQNTTQGGTHQAAFKEHIAKTIKEYSGKNFEVQDVRNGLVAAIAIRVIEPMFESQTKIKLGSLYMAPDKDKSGQPFLLSGVSVNKFVGDFIKEQVDNFLHRNTDIAETILQKIQESEKERKAMAGVAKLARERAKKANLHNKKLRDCHVHFSDPAPKRKKGEEDEADPRQDSSIFITEGNSASGSITQCRDVNTQAVFSLRGKPLNCYGLTKKVVYENEEFNLLQAALNIEDGLDGLRYNKVIIATDADVDGMHIRLLMMTFFLQFFPDLVKKGHVFILQTPLFRVRNKKKGAKEKKGGRAEFETIYCYTEEERLAAIERLAGPTMEITRFKGLGEISADEFKHFIGPDMRLEPVTLHKSDQVSDLLSYYMGKNTMERQNFIIDNLVVEEDLVEEAPL
ncbi:MAG: DNA topoisomerase IV subunit B [Bacteroidales bacterium]|nr:DNA topoisomerase IV subunit B [Bacteroidales bacterium]